MATLSRTDAERVLRFVADAADVGGDHPFTPEFLVELGGLIEAEYVGYNETDHVHRRLLLLVLRPGDDDVDEAQAEDWEMSDDDWDLMHEHPICRQWRRDGHFRALRMSDVAPQREVRRSRIYAMDWRPWGIEHELKVRLPSPPWHAKTFAFQRKRGRDFTVRDRLVLELLTPHLSRLWHAASTRRLLAAAIAALDSASECAQRGIVLLGYGDRAEFVSAPAQRLLQAFFPPAAASRLPKELVRWLASGTHEPLRRRREDMFLTVMRTQDTLLLQEQRVDVELTARENEVMGWVARGKTNAQIAELLWLAPSTVRKHLENVYAKLGVSTRTAAAARFLGLIEAEAS